MAKYPHGEKELILPFLLFSDRENLRGPEKVFLYILLILKALRPRMAEVNFAEVGPREQQWQNTPVPTRGGYLPKVGFSLGGRSCC
jgi:hypothetical protein